MNAQYEFCDVCDLATGKACRGDDSLYVTDCDGNEIGPLCEICYEIYTSEDADEEPKS